MADPDLQNAAVSNLVTQFSSKTDCFRELVQNSIDAGSTRVDVWMEYEPGDGHLGTIEIHVDDFGEGMDEAIIDGQLTQLFSSSKENDLTKIGKFGIGFVSVFALEPAGVLVEILHEDGSMARRPELETFAQKHGLKIGTIADLIRYRMETEKTVERVHEEDVETEAGPFRLVAWRDLLSHELHFALVRGTVDDGEPVPTRVHVRNTLSDVLHVKRDDLGMTVTAALRRIAEDGRGVLLVLSGEDTADALLARLKGTHEEMAAEDAPMEWRQHGLGAQILADLGVRRLQVLGTPRKLVGLGGFGLEVVGHG